MLCGILLLWAGVLNALSVQREQAVRGAVQNTANLARAFEETIIRTFKTVDQTLLLVRDAYQRDPRGFDVASWSRSMMALTDLDSQVGLMDRDGMMIASNYAPVVTRIDLSDREHFRAQRDSRGDDLFVGKPVVGRVTHKQTIQITRKMMRSDGSFDGAVVLSLDPEYLSGFYRSVDIGSLGVVTVVGTDGIVRAIARPVGVPGTLAIGDSMAGGPLMRVVAKEPSGTFTAASQTDGVRRIFSYRAVRGYSLIVNVGLAEDEVLAAYKTTRLNYVILATLVSVSLLAIAILLLVRQNRLRRARELLHASQAAHARKSHLLQTTLEHINQGILMVDSGGQIQVCNQWAIDRLGLPHGLMARLPGVSRQNWRRGDFDSDPAGFAAWARLFALADGVSEGRPVETLDRHEEVEADGTVLEIRGTPTPDGGIVRTFTDITMRKQYEAGLHAARDAADRSARVKSEFLATMSHEIRSPMSGLLGVLELLRRTRLDPDQSRMAGMVHGSASALLGVLNDILDFSKIEAEALVIDPEIISPRDLVDEIAQPYAAAAGLKGVTLTTRFSPDMPAWLVVDALRLRQIVNNLLSNAMKFTAEGEIVLTADVLADPAGDRLRISVRDTGIGMDEEVLARLFRPFMQADGSTTRSFGGTGLGLSISLRLARLMHGDLVASSEAGAGSTFTLTLPLVAADAPDIADEPPPDQSDLVALGGHARVLVADDDPANRWVARRMLGILGFQVEAVENGEIALRMLREGDYAMLVTDCHMPRMDGVTLTRTLRDSADPRLRDLPVIGLTADVTAEQRARCLAAGMTDVDIKPLTLDRLTRLVSRHVRSASGHARAEELPVSPTGTPFDATIYREIFATGDPEGAAWIDDYLAAALPLFDELAALLSDAAEDVLPRDLIAETAHRLVGASLTVGAGQVGEAARRLEHAATSDDPRALRTLLAAAREACETARRAMAEFLSHEQPELTL